MQQFILFLTIVVGGGGREGRVTNPALRDFLEKSKNKIVSVKWGVREKSENS